MRKLALIAASAAIMSTAMGAGIALAEGDDTLQNQEHRVDIKGGVFFPPVILASTGDKIEFYNEESTVQSAVATDESWDTGDIEPGNSVEITVSTAMTMCFQSRQDPELQGAIGSAESGEAPACFNLIN